MENYTIKPGNIAAMCHVITPSNTELDYIFLADNKLPEATPSNTVPFDALPLPVRAAVNKHFGNIFAMPANRRGEYLQACAQWTVRA